MDEVLNFSVFTVRFICLLAIIDLFVVLNKVYDIFYGNNRLRILN